MIARSFFTAASLEAIADEKAIGGDAQGRVMMKAAPATPFIMREAELLLELLVIPFDVPARHGRSDQRAQCRVRWQIAQPVVHQFGFALGPFDAEQLKPVYWGCSRRPGMHRLGKLPIDGIGVPG